MSRALSKTQQSQQLAAQHQQQNQSQHARDVETTEHKSTANASAGLNLNLGGALSGALSSTKRKETHSKPDGSKHTIEDSHDQASAAGHATGNGAAYASGNTTDGTKHERRRELAQDQSQGHKKIAASQSQKQQTDHLGIEN